MRPVPTNIASFVIHMHEGKRAFETEAEAAAAVAIMLARPDFNAHGTGYNFYKCPLCRKFHHGSPGNDEKLAKKVRQFKAWLLEDKMMRGWLIQACLTLTEEKKSHQLTRMSLADTLASHPS